MDKMPKAEEQRIVSALEVAVKTANDGATPDEAIVKAASDAQFGPETVKRMVEAFNVSKTLGHLKKASADRSATFPIANIENIIGTMWPADPETPQKSAALGLHPDYLIDAPADITGLLKAAQLTELPPLTDKVAEPYQQDRGTAVQKAIHDHEKLARLRDDCESTFRETFMKIWGCLDKAAAYYRQVGPVEDFEMVEKRAHATFGPAVKNFMDMLYEGANLGDHRLQVKRASADDLVGQQMHFDYSAEPYCHIADAMACTKAVLDLRKQAQDIQAVEHRHALSNYDRLPPQPVVAAIEAELRKTSADQDVTGRAKAIYRDIRRELASHEHVKAAEVAPAPVEAPPEPTIRPLAEITHGYKPAPEPVEKQASDLDDLFQE